MDSRVRRQTVYFPSRAESHPWLAARPPITKLRDAGDYASGEEHSRKHRTAPEMEDTPDLPQTKKFKKVCSLSSPGNTNKTDNYVGLAVENIYKGFWKGVIPHGRNVQTILWVAWQHHPASRDRNIYKAYQTFVACTLQKLSDTDPGN